ncbi:hypothetical protein JCM14036_14660 [Desulfotomaculum defluvii]
MLRVSTNLLGNNLRNYIQNNLQKAAKYQEQTATGKTINRPSDDPSQISYLMSVNSSLISNEQYSRNIEDGLAYLNQSDSALDTIGKVLQDAKVLALQGANSLTQEDMNAIAEQIDRQVEALLDLSNSALGGKYLFAGRKNGQPPFYRDPDSGDIYYRGDTNLISREIIFGYSYEVVAAGVTDNFIKSSTNLSEGTKLTDDDMVFTLQLDEDHAEQINLKNHIQSNTPGAPANYYSFSEIKDALQAAIDEKFPPDTSTTPAKKQITVLDDGQGHIKLQANTVTQDFKLYAPDAELYPTGNGHLTLFGGDRSVSNGVFGKLADPDNKDNQLEDKMNSSQPMVKVVGGPFEVLRNLSKNLKEGNAQGIQDSLDQLEVAHDEILKHRVGVGARTRHLEAVQDQLADQEVKLKGILVDIQGADIAKLTIEVAQNQLIHQASLMTASNLLNTTLLNYLK